VKREREEEKNKGAGRRKRQQVKEGGKTRRTRNPFRKATRLSYMVERTSIYREQEKRKSSTHNSS
jgi:hypothetical protein